MHLAVVKCPLRVTVRSVRLSIDCNLMPYDNVEAPLRVSIVVLTLDVSNTVQTHCADAMFCVKILRSVLTILLVVQTLLFGLSFSLGLLCSYLSYVYVWCLWLSLKQGNLWSLPTPKISPTSHPFFVVTNSFWHTDQNFAQSTCCLARAWVISFLSLLYM